MDPYEQLVSEIKDLETQRNQLYIQIRDIGIVLEHKNLMRSTFQAIVSDDTLVNNSLEVLQKYGVEKEPLPQ